MKEQSDIAADRRKPFDRLARPKAGGRLYPRQAEPVWSLSGILLKYE
jgi:hypothetical protein